VQDGSGADVAKGTPMNVSPHLASELTRLRRIWLAFLAAPLLYGVVLALVGDVATNVDPELLQWLTIFLGVFAGCELLVVFLVRPLIVGITGSSYTNYCIVRWALLESIAVFGLVVRFLGGSLTAAAIFIALSLAMIAITGPKQDEAAELQKQWG
jgi:hypothetical protein